MSVQAPGYHNRTVRLEDIYSQNEVFMIEKGGHDGRDRFVVDDRTGNFPPE